MNPVTVYVSIGNSDDKLTQERWAEFTSDVFTVLHAAKIHGEWYSSPTSRFQNACWCVEFQTVGDASKARLDLRILASVYGQEAIAWAVAETELLEPLAGGHGWTGEAV